MRAVRGFRWVKGQSRTGDQTFTGTQSYVHMHTHAHKEERLTLYLYIQVVQEVNLQPEECTLIFENICNMFKY